MATTNFPTAASRPFYTRLNQQRAERYFDDFVEGQCQPCYAEIKGRPGLPPVVDWLFPPTDEQVNRVD